MTASASSDATRVEKIEGRWTLQILLCLNAGELRFSDLRTAIPGSSPNVLADRIRALQAAGLVERRYLPPPTARHLYALGPLAGELKPVLEALANWCGDKSGRFSAAIPDGSSIQEKELRQ